MAKALRAEDRLPEVAWDSECGSRSISWQGWQLAWVSA